MNDDTKERVRVFFAWFGYTLLIIWIGFMFGKAKGFSEGQISDSFYPTPRSEWKPGCLGSREECIDDQANFDDKANEAINDHSKEIGLLTDYLGVVKWKEWDKECLTNVAELQEVENGTYIIPGAYTGRCKKIYYTDDPDKVFYSELCVLVFGAHQEGFKTPNVSEKDMQKCLLLKKKFGL